MKKFLYVLMAGVMVLALSKMVAAEEATAPAMEEEQVVADTMGDAQEQGDAMMDEVTNAVTNAVTMPEEVPANTEMGK